MGHRSWRGRVTRSLVGRFVPACRTLVDRLRRDGGTLRWVGEPSLPRPNWVDGVALPLARAAGGVLVGRPVDRRRLLPSEERAVAGLETRLLAWRERVSVWRIATPGDQDWTPEQAAAWRAALQAWIGGGLLLVWRLFLWGIGMRSAASMAGRRVRLAIDKAGRSR